MHLHPAMIVFYDGRRMQAPDAVLARRFLHGCWHASRQLEALLAMQGDVGLSDLVVLEYAAYSDLGPSAIADAVRLPDHTVSRVLGRLEAAGLVERHLAQGDGRRRTLVATGAGRALLERLHHAIQVHVAALVPDHDAARLTVFADVLTAVVAADPAAPTDAALSGSGAARSGARRGSAPRRR